jgi:predicted tellurium resistance membrane protein TerC
VLIFGLAVAIGMMGLAANYIARRLRRHQWIAYLGLIIILYVSPDMIWRGSMDLAPYVASLY